MALISPGVQVTVSDESQYQPTAVGTVPYILIATAQDKLDQSGSAIASGTTQANAERLYTVTSQRELISTFGYPVFQQDANGNPINGDERNEYGLLAAYSALGVANRVYVQRADVDLNQLEGTAIRPTGTPPDGIYWLDLGFSQLGLHEFVVTGDSASFNNVTADIITDADYLGGGGAPISSYGAIGDYAVNATITSVPVYLKRYDNTWVLVGSNAWKLAVPTIVGSESNPTTLASGQKFVINGSNVTLTGSTVSSVATDIASAGIQGVTATVNTSGQLEIRADGTAASTGNVSLPDGKIVIKSGTTVGATDAAEKLGLFTAAELAANVHITGKTLFVPAVQFSDYRDVPAWRPTDATPRPSGSVWFKTSAVGNGAVFPIKQYSSTLAGFTLLATPLYQDDFAAVYGLDPVGGGTQITAGSLYVKYDTLGTNTATFKVYLKQVAGVLKVTGSVPASPFVLDAGDSFTMEVSVPGTEVTQSATITLPDEGGGDCSAEGLVAAILAANLPNVVANVESSGAISISHLAGGLIKFTYGVGTVLADIGITAATPADNIQIITAGQVYLASPWTPLAYTASTTAPFSDPVDGTLWYYNNPLEVDIMVHDGSGWKGYGTVANDARGYDLTNTDPEGPILSATQPSKQADGTTNVVAGDLWVDTSDLENYPVIRRYNGTTWDLIDNTDQVTSDGIVFADARWGTNGDINPITGELPFIRDLSLSNYIDDDCPDYRLYPRGSLLFNTRRSGYNVKRFESEWFSNPDRFTGTVNPTVKSAWVTHSGVAPDGVPYFGSKAQRNTVVEALKAAVESSVNLREEQVEFNLMVCPGYPELINNLITLNNDRKQTAFIIGDSPLTLNSSSTSVQAWSANENLATDNGPDGLVATSEYVGVYYPSGLATNLDGNSVVVPPSHAMLRTYIRSDNQSYPWFAPAGVRRGVLDNISSIGYIDTTDSNVFKSIGVTQGLRDVLYTNRVNPLTVLPGVGLVAYGQKTRSPMTSAMDRVNVARLICYLRLVLDKVARPFIFEPNDTITRNQVKSAFEAVLNDLVAKRGLYDYLVVCDDTNNTPDRIDRNELWIDIAIEPVKAIEFIYIPVRIKGTGDIAAGL